MSFPIRGFVVERSESPDVAALTSRLSKTHAIEMQKMEESMALLKERMEEEKRVDLERLTLEMEQKAATEIEGILHHQSTEVKKLRARDAARVEALEEQLKAQPAIPVIGALKRRPAGFARKSIHDLTASAEAKKAEVKLVPFDRTNAVGQ
jgi:hypothetical protein